MDLKELQEKIHKKKGVVIRYDDKGNPFVSVPVGSVPLKQFDEWQEICDRDYNGNRWLMVWTQYLRCKHYDAQEQIAQLEEEAMTREDEEEHDDNPLGLLSPGKE